MTDKALTSIAEKIQKEVNYWGHWWKLSFDRHGNRVDIELDTSYWVPSLVGPWQFHGRAASPVSIKWVEGSLAYMSSVREEFGPKEAPPVEPAVVELVNGPLKRLKELRYEAIDYSFQAWQELEKLDELLQETADNFQIIDNGYHSQLANLKHIREDIITAENNSDKGQDVTALARELADYIEDVVRVRSRHAREAVAKLETWRAIVGDAIDMYKQDTKELRNDQAK